VFFSRKPVNVLTGLTRRPGRIEIEYTFGTNGKGMIALDRHAATTDIFPQIVKIMSGGGKQRIGFKITPRPAKGKPFTTGNEILDKLAADTLLFIEGGCEYDPEVIRVDSSNRREHRLIISRVYVHTSSVSRGQKQGEFALVTDLVISTKGAVTFGTVTATAV
jgi:hypothetical protein